jgi:uncharacterized protein (TIGR02996 family)
VPSPLALLAAIRAAPDDPAAKEAYADHLRESGDPTWADFVVASLAAEPFWCQCQSDAQHNCPGCVERRALQTRVEGLTDRVVPPDWVAKPGKASPSFSHGLARAVTPTTAASMAHYLCVNLATRADGQGGTLHFDTLWVGGLAVRLDCSSAENFFRYAGYWFSRLPIAQVDLVGRRPLETSQGSGPPGFVYGWRPGTPESGAAAVPWELWDRLAADPRLTEHPGGMFLYAHDRAAALGALSDACVAYGVEKASPP